MNSDNIILGPGYLNHASANYRFAEGGIRVKLIKNLREVSAEEFARFDSVQTDRMIEVTGRVWSGWENLSTLFPSAALNPTIGAKIFGTTDVPLTINAQNGDRLLVHRAKITQLANLKLSVREELFSADVKWTGLLKSSSLPSDALSYFTESTGQAYTAPSFTKANFKAPVIDAAWTGKTGFTSFAAKEGWDINWNYALDGGPCYVDGYGTIDMIIDGFEGRASCIPIGPTLAQVLANMNMQSQALGTLESSNAADLTLTASGLSVTLYQAFIAENDGLAYARKNLRLGGLTWRTTVPFSAGAPTARAAVA